MQDVDKAIWDRARQIFESEGLKGVAFALTDKGLPDELKEHRPDVLSKPMREVYLSRAEAEARSKAHQRS
jgi:hypothetical protein